jgi:hypothetical protein
MPGPIVHLIVQQRLAEQLRTHPDGAAYARLLDADRCSPYAHFGAMGPDFLFFSVREYGAPLGDLTNFIFGVYDALEPLIVFYERNVEPVVQGLEAAVNAADQALFQGLLGNIKATAELATDTALNAAAVVLTTHVDLFYPFYPKIQQGVPEAQWYWFDFLHYRRTGRFASTLWRLAGDDDLRRYAIGYAGHVGTDVVGHPFVNAVVGGPFRTHWHRHKLVENWIDAYARDHYRDPRWLDACLRLQPGDIRLQDSIAGSYYGRLVEFPRGRLPAKLSRLLVQAVQETYVADRNGGVGHPPVFTAADFDAAYRLWLKWFKRATEIGDGQPPPHMPFPGSALLQDYLNSLPPFPGGGGVPGGGFSVVGVLAALFAFAKWMAEVAIATLVWMIDNAAQIILLPFAIASWLIHQLRKAIWELYDSLRFALVLGGYLFPEARDLRKPLWGRAFINTSFTQLTGGLSANVNFMNYPFRQEAHAAIGTTEHHLVYPGQGGAPPEQNMAEPAPMPFHGVNPEAFISGSYPFDPFIESLYACTTPYGRTADATHHVDQRSWQTAQLGSALGFSARLIATRLERGIPNFNLDGDRGYGWKTWRAVRGDEVLEDAGLAGSRNPTVDVTYIDP